MVSLKYLAASGVLFILALSYSLIALANLIINYGLSLNKIGKDSYFLLFFVLLEFILFGLFHSSLIEFSLSLLAVSFLMFLYSIIKAEKGEIIKK